MARVAIANKASGRAPASDGARTGCRAVLFNKIRCPEFSHRLFDCFIAVLDAVLVEQFTDYGTLQCLRIKNHRIAERPFRFRVKVSDLIAAERRPDHDLLVQQHPVKLLIGR